MSEYEIPSESHERTLALIMYLSTFFAALFGPLIIWMMKKEDSELIDYHGRECLNLWLTSVIFSLLMVVISIATMGIGAVVAVLTGSAFLVQSL